MIAVDTNILARFYVDDPGDPEAARQRPLAREVMEFAAVHVPVTVILELEWVLRAFYRFTNDRAMSVFQHLLGLPNVTVEEWPRVLDAIQLCERGLDFADALHLAGSRDCQAFYTFDERRFARRERARDKAQDKHKLPPVRLPG